MTLFTSLLDINIPHWKTVSSGFTHNLLKRRVGGKRCRFNIEQMTFVNELSWFENQKGIVTVYCLVLGSMMASFTSKLKEKDEFLYNRIKELDLKPQYYAFRWLTLLLSQEFPLPGTILNQVLYTCISRIQCHKVQLPYFQSYRCLPLWFSMKLLFQHSCFILYFDRNPFV